MAGMVALTGETPAAQVLVRTRQKSLAPTVSRAHDLEPSALLCKRINTHPQVELALFFLLVFPCLKKGG